MNEQVKINWYRCKVDKKVMSELMKTSDARGLAQCLGQLGLFLTTGLLAFYAYTNIHANNWWWSVPFTLWALFIHGTFACFMGAAAPVHELSHKTPFKTKWLNEIFLKIFAFVSWTDYVGFRASHVKHHQVTTHTDYDEEVVLPQTMNETFVMVLKAFTFDPVGVYKHIRSVVLTALGKKPDWMFKASWIDKVIPESEANTKLRRERINSARIIVLGHLALATIFIATGNWFLVIVFDLGIFYCGWLTMLCGTPQHYGLSPNVPDHRLCCRTYTCSWLPAFLYWNMQHHIEHHMFPAVPFYNLGKLRKAIAHDMPKPIHGLLPTWRHLVEISRRCKADPAYLYVPELPRNTGERASDLVLEQEAADNVVPA
jgi:fatty acid desaturase